MTLLNPYRFGAVGGGAGDIYFANTIMLLGLNSTGDLDRFSDESAAAKGLCSNVNNIPNLDTADKVFGAGSALFNGTTDHLQWADDADFTLADDDFTLEFFIRLSSVTSTRSFVSKHNASNSNKGWVLQYNGTSKVLTFYGAATVGGTTTAIVSGAFNPTADTWYYLAVDRASDVFRIYTGQPGGSTTMIDSDTNTMAFADNASSFRISGQGSGAELFAGWMDEFRLTRGVARYASDAGFTVPTAAFPRS